MNKHLSLGMPTPMQARLQSGELRKALEELLGPQARPATTGRGGGPLPGAHRSRPCCSRRSWLSSGGGDVKRVNLREINVNRYQDFYVLTTYCSTSINLYRDYTKPVANKFLTIRILHTILCAKGAEDYV